MPPKAVATFGLPTDIDPHEALRQELARTNGHVTWLHELVAALERDELKQYTRDKGLLWEKPAVWVELYQGERAHLVKVAGEAVRCGVVERLTAIQEDQADLVMAAFQAALDELGVDPAKAMPAIAQHLRVIEGGAAESA